MDVQLKIFINSADRVGGSSTDFTLPTFLDFPDNYEFKVRVQSVGFPNTIPSFRSGIDNLLQVKINNTVSTLTIPPGNYTGSSIATALTTALQTLDAGLTVTYDAATLKLLLTNTNAVQFGLFEAEQHYATASSNKLTKSERCALNLGWYNLIGATISTAITATTVEPVRLSGPLYADIVVATFVQSYHSSQKIGNVIARVPIDVAFGEFVFWEEQGGSINEGQYITADRLQHLRFTIVDEYGDQLALTPHTNFSMVLLLNQHSEEEK